MTLNFYFRYEGRCGLPTNFDANYCYALGYGAGALLHSGKTGLISSVCVSILFFSVLNFIFHLFVAFMFLCKVKHVPFNFSGWTSKFKLLYNFIEVILLPGGKFGCSSWRMDSGRNGIDFFDGCGEETWFATASLISLSLLSSNHISFFIFSKPYHLAGKFKPVIKKAMVELEGNAAMPSILYCLHCTKSWHCAGTALVLLMPLRALVLMWSSVTLVSFSFGPQKPKQILSASFEIPGAPFKKFASLRDEWALKNRYVSPGMPLHLFPASMWRLDKYNRPELAPTIKSNQLKSVQPLVFYKTG